jgi:hypothetical protein
MDRVEAFRVIMRLIDAAVRRGGKSSWSERRLAALVSAAAYMRAWDGCADRDEQIAFLEPDLSSKLDAIGRAAQR